MRFSSQIKPISYLKAHASEILRQLGENREIMVITQNGEAKAILQDVSTYEETLETLALLKILALGQREIGTGLVEPAGSAFKRIRSQQSLRKSLPRTRKLP